MLPDTPVPTPARPTTAVTSASTPLLPDTPAPTPARPTTAVTSTSTPLLTTHQHQRALHSDSSDDINTTDDEYTSTTTSSPSDSNDDSNTTDDEYTSTTTSSPSDSNGNDDTNATAAGHGYADLTLATTGSLPQSNVQQLVDRLYNDCTDCIACTRSSKTTKSQPHAHLLSTSNSTNKLLLIASK